MLSDIINDDVAALACEDRYNVLMADGHVANMSAAELNTASGLRMKHPTASIPD